MQIKIKVLLIALIVIIVCNGCSTDGNIKSFVSSKEKELAKSNNWMISDATITCYEWSDRDYFSNDKILSLAISYSEWTKYADQKRKEAGEYLFSGEAIYSNNPNASNVAERLEESAKQYEELANNDKTKLLDLIKSAEISNKPQGIWVIYTFNYKEYLGPNTWNGPFTRSYLYLLDKNGKKELISREITRAKDIFNDFSVITGKTYNVRYIN